jgi:hypothetical protein
MNIETAKRISIVSMLENLNIKPERESAKETWYLSPVRKENTPNFVVYKSNNRRYDYGIAMRGDPIDFACAFLSHTGKPYTVQDGLAMRDTMQLLTTSIFPFQKSGPFLVNNNYN